MYLHWTVYTTCQQQVVKFPIRNTYAEFIKKCFQETFSKINILIINILGIFDVKGVKNLPKIRQWQVCFETMVTEMELSP